MSLLPEKKPDPENAAIAALQMEISALQKTFDLERIKLNGFNQLIHTQLDKVIAQVLHLFELYKSQKKAKKDKRLAQKKKGKNYKEPTAVIQKSILVANNFGLDKETQQEIRRIYKEAILQVHPDKIHHDSGEEKIQKATAITAQLNGLYKKGDLEELIQFYQFVILGDEAADQDNTTHPIVNSKVRLDALRKKKIDILKQIEDLQQSFTYQVLVTYENPLTFIDELRIQFQERIKQLEKRTRTKL
jgi:hypothetical protein